MRHRLWMVPFLITTLVATGVAFAEPIGSHWELTPFGGYTLFDGKLKFPDSQLPIADNRHLGGRLAWQSSSWIGIEAVGGLASSKEDGPNGRDFDWLHASGNLVLSPAQGRFGGPFAFVGGGWAQSKPSGLPRTETGTIEFGGGLRLWLTDALGLRFEARDVSYKPLVTATASPHLNNMVLGLGLTFAFGARARDTDGDSVPDRIDREPNTPKGAHVDQFGVAIDSDGDGVPDGIDRNPDTPKGALVDQWGVPSDDDHDGVYNGLDKCPDTAAGVLVDANGCPKDSDGDGVFDGLDKCPDTPKGATADSVGCPDDSDSDGVADGLDKCPDTGPGLKVDANGCPIEVRDIQEKILDSGRFEQHIHFETGKAEVRSDSFDSLNVVGQLMLAWPDLKLEIGGHTDSRGSAALNQSLSEKRAQAVKDYLLGKFASIKQEQLTAKGYGPSRPVAPNTSAGDMAKNRRVEFVVTNKEMLKERIETRRLLKAGEKPPPAPEPPTPAPADTTRK